MKKKTGKAGTKRAVVKDLATRKGRSVKGGVEPVGGKLQRPRPAEPINT